MCQTLLIRGGGNYDRIRINVPYSGSRNY
ncbi:hypothetical protein HMPREF9454_00310, partial [Megamonas funiformis YIT 11815]